MILPGLFFSVPLPLLLLSAVGTVASTMAPAPCFLLFLCIPPCCQCVRSLPRPHQERCLLCCVRLSKPLTSCTQSNWRAYCCLPMVLCHPCRSQSPRDSWDLSCLSGSVLSVCLGEGLKRVFSAESLDPKPVGGIHQGCCGEWKSNQPL